MRYKVFVADFDGTIADHGYVAKETLEALKKLKATGRKLILVTGREMKDLERIFSEYKIFDYVIAENGAVIHNSDTGAEELLGPSPNTEFVKLGLRASNLMMLAHIAEGIDEETWEYHLKRNDFTNWFRESIEDEELANVSDSAQPKSAPESNKR